MELWSGGRGAADPRRGTRDEGVGAEGHVAGWPCRDRSHNRRESGRDHPGRPRRDSHGSRRAMITPRRLAALVLLSALWADCRNPPPPQSRQLQAAQQREAAYRANNRGVAQMEQDAYADAARAFREALTADAELRLARINLAIALYHAGQLPEALQAASDARRESPDAPQPAYVLGLIARAQGQPQAAVDAFMRVLAIDPSDIGSKLNLAMVRLGQGRYQEAVALCRAVLADEPYNPTPAYNLALALARAGDEGVSAQAMRQFEPLRNGPDAVP